MHHFWDTIIEPIVEILRPKVMVEIGSDLGLNTRNLLEFCRRTGAVLHVIDPSPRYDVAEWQERYGEHLVFHKDLSLAALPTIERFDVVLIDGDHNWFTVYNELKLIEERSEALSWPFPLVVLHDVGWPYGRRDLYYDPETIPQEHRKPHAKKGMSPDSAELLDEGGINQYLSNALRDNEPQSGVLTAVEDFMSETGENVELITLPGLNGLALLVPSRLKGNPDLKGVLETLRLPQAVARHLEQVELARLRLQVRHQEQRAALRQLSEQHEAQAARFRRKLAKFEEGQHPREVERLVLWFEQLDEGVAQVLNSRRWRLSYELSQVLCKVLNRSPEPAVPDAVQKARKEFYAWRKRFRRPKRRTGTAEAQDQD
jgi:predicted transcriptional regulator